MATHDYPYPCKVHESCMVMINALAAEFGLRVVTTSPSLSTNGETIWTMEGHSDRNPYIKVRRHHATS